MDVCIGCMQGREMKPMLPLSGFNSDETLSWNEMYMSTTQLQIEQNEGLPEEICIDCKEKLLNSFAFKTMCHQSYVRLKGLQVNIENDEDTKHNVWKSINSATKHDASSSSIDNKSQSPICIDKNQIINTSYSNDKSTQISASDWIDTFDCSKCQQQFTSRARLRVHKKSHLNVNKEINTQHKITTRRKCKKSNNKNTSVETRATNALLCCMCDVTFETQSDFDKHQRSHKKRKSFNCAKCERVFSNVILYESHNCEAKYQCRMCNKAFTSLIKLNKHIGLHKQDLNNENEIFEQKIRPDCNDKENYCENKLILDCNVNGLTSDCDNIDNKTLLEQNKSSENDTTYSEDNKETKTDILDLNIKETLSGDEEEKSEDSKLFADCKSLQDVVNPVHSNNEVISVKEEPIDTMFEETDWDNGAMIDDEGPYSMEDLYADDPDFKKVPKLEKDIGKVKGSLKKRLHSKLIGCNVCDLVFPTKLRLKKHRIAEHATMEGLFNCTMCNKHFDDEQSLQEHKSTHDASSQIYQCEMCTKKFYKQSHLTKHMWQHMEEKPFKCNVCSKGFMNQRFLDRHKTALHSGKGKNPKIAFCETCGRGFTTAKYLETHMRMHNGDRTFTCDVCDKSFNSKWHLKEHSKWHSSEKPFLCSECGQSFIRSDYLVIHMRRHNGEKPYKCKFCDKGFPRATDLTVHERYHTGEKTHLCTVCGKGFQRQYNLTVHLRVHTGEKPYVCTYCGKTFAQGNDLKSHVRRHTGERFNCDLCNEGFIQAYHLTQHKRTIHGIDCPSNIRRILKLPQAPQPNDNKSE